MPKEDQKARRQIPQRTRADRGRPAGTAAKTIEQRLKFASSDIKIKREVLRDLINVSSVKNAIIFCNRKRDVGILLKSLLKHGYNAGGLHGDMEQRDRTATLDAFRRGDISLLAASDVAARGLDIPDVSHIFNFDVPITPRTTSTASAAPGAPARRAMPRRWSPRAISKRCARSKSFAAKRSNGSAASRPGRYRRRPAEPVRLHAARAAGGRRRRPDILAPGRREDAQAGGFRTGREKAARALTWRQATSRRGRKAVAQQQDESQGSRRRRGEGDKIAKPEIVGQDEAKVAKRSRWRLRQAT